MKTIHKLHKHKKKYWYEYFYLYCPLCGRTQTYKKRKYTNKPKDSGTKHHLEEVYDWCDL